MRALTRAWQMLLKALDEVASAPNTMMAAEMALIRLTHVAELPTPEELVRKLNDMPPPRPPSGPGAGRPAPSEGGENARAGGGAAAIPDRAPAAPRLQRGGGPAAALQQAPETALARYGAFEDVIRLIRTNRDVKLLVEVETGLRLARYAPGRIEFTPAGNAPADLASRLAQRLQAWTGVRWGVTVVSGATAPTIVETRDAERLRLEEQGRGNPLVQAVFEAFSDARFTAIRTVEEIEQHAAEEALPEVPDDWDPFEED